MGRTTTDDRPLTSIELIRARAAAEPDVAATFHRHESGSWMATSWIQLWREIGRAAAAFRSVGLRRGDRLAIMSRTCREWQVAEFAAALVGAVVVGVDTHAAPDQIAYVLDRSGASGLVADNSTTLGKVPQRMLERLSFVLVVSPGTALESARRQWSWTEVVAQVAAGDAELAAAASIDPDDTAVLIFTSGTTGQPKGIEYTHRQVMTACWTMVDAYAALANGRLVCWLPMAALFQRMMNLVGFAHQSVTYFVEDPRDIVARLPEIRPTALTSVPRFYERVHSGIREQLGRQRGWKRSLADAALAAGDRRSRLERQGRPVPFLLRARHTVLDALVLRKIRGALGGEIKALISGSAALPVWLAEFFFSLGLPVLEAYGVTENPLPIAGNRPGDFRVGSVGKPFAGNHVRLSADGEVLVKGTTLFSGYSGEPFPIDRFTDDGYYRTGDYGRFDEDGYLYLTGRVADIIKTSGGRRISPAAVESAYAQSPLVEQMVVFGTNRPHLCALIVPDWQRVKTGIGVAADDGSAPLTRTQLERARALVRAEIDRLGTSLSTYERVRRFALLEQPFSIDRGELTPTLKLRRPHIEKAYESVIDGLYREDSALAAARS
jgi:long-chain acyl-CoA synthetase